MARQRQLTWAHLSGRKQPYINAQIYQLFLLAMQETLEQGLGQEAAAQALRKAGILGGRLVYGHFCQGTSDFMTVAGYLEKLFKDMQIGLFRIENSDAIRQTLTVSVDEDMGPVDSPSACCPPHYYEEGFLQGTFEAALHKPFTAKEIEAWYTGARSCRFVVKESQEAGYD